MGTLDTVWDSFKDGWHAGELAQPKISGHCKLIEDFQASSAHFYELVLDALEHRKIPGLSISRVDYKEGWFFSASRRYLRIQRKKIAFEICGAPFGTGFFVSTRMVEYPPSNNIFMRILRAIFNPNTYYKLDIAAMYKLSIENSVAEAVEELIKAPSHSGNV